jgi:hypothetical protein
MNITDTNFNIEDKILKRKEYMKEYQKVYQKEYKEKNKDKIKNYDSNKYSKERNEKHKLYVKKNAEILKLIKQAYNDNDLIIKNETIFSKLNELLK